MDDRCQLYREVNLYGRRYRHMRVLKGSEVRSYIDDMGPEDAFTVEQFVIPVADDEVSEWNTVGECIEVAADIHASGGLVRQRRRTQAATGKDWAEQYVRQQEYLDLERRAVSQFGAGGFVQRTKEWRR